VNDLVVKVGALGNCLQIILHAPREVFLCPHVPFEICCTEVPFKGSHSLYATAEQVELLVDIILISCVIFLLLHKEYSLKVQCDAGRCRLGSKKPFDRGDIVRLDWCSMIETLSLLTT
jgi:hypothetical protein